MGQGQSVPTTPLQCLLNNFSDFFKRASGFGVPVKPGTLRTLCELEWTTFDVGWPAVGSFDLILIRNVEAVILGSPGHPDQIPYIETWLDIAKVKPGYIKRCQRKLPGSTCPSLLTVKKGGEPCVRLPLTPSTKPRILMDDQAGPEDTLDTWTQPLPYAPSSQASGSPPHTTPSPARMRSGLPYGLCPSVPPKSTLPLPSSGHGDRRVSSASPNTGPEPATLLPLWELAPAQGTGRPFMVYVPFSTSDLYNWKLQNPLFSEKPQGLISLLEMIFHTHRPTWDDCQQLLQVLFTSEERDRIHLEARKQIFGAGGQPTTDPVILETSLPAQQPNWDPNTVAGEGALTRYRQLLLQGLRGAARKPTNLSKVSEIVQSPRESPAAFLERLLEAYRQYTPIDPRAPENARTINIAFVTQSAPDIRKKIQKLDGFEGK
uniref:Gag protein n=2 Tax=Varanus komodoensis TaxID=61221 RepID=A0A8D2KRZ6_VARKO